MASLIPAHNGYETREFGSLEGTCTTCTEESGSSQRLVEINCDINCQSGYGTFPISPQAKVRYLSWRVSTILRCDLFPVPRIHRILAENVTECRDLPLEWVLRPRDLCSCDGRALFSGLVTTFFGSITSCPDLRSEGYSLACFFPVGLLSSRLAD